MELRIHRPCCNLFYSKNLSQSAQKLNKSALHSDLLMPYPAFLTQSNQRVRLKHCFVPLQTQTKPELNVMYADRELSSVVIVVFG